MAVGAAILAFAATLVALAGATLGGSNPYLDLAGQFLSPAACASALACAVFLLRRNIAPAVLAGAAVGAAIFIAWPRPAMPVCPTGAPTHRIVFHNVWSSSRQPAETVDYLLSAGADALVLTEVGPRFAPVLGRVRAAYPFATNAANATRVETLIFSKTPLTDLTEVPAERARRSWISLVSARLAFADGELTLIGDHLARPWPFTRPWVQGLQAEALATRFAAAPPARLLVGDLNGATWGHVVRTVAARGEARALGSWGTWPTWLAGALRLPIDHAITGPGIACAKKTVGPKTGSDHRPILVEFALEPAASAAPR